METLGRFAQLRGLVQATVDQFTVDEIFIEEMSGPDLVERASGEWVCNSCGGRGESADVEHDSKCLLALARAAFDAVPALVAEVRKLRELESAMLNMVEASLVTPYRSTRPEMQAIFDVMEKLGHLMPKKAGS